jgi:hypothetical protein
MPSKPEQPKVVLEVTEHPCGEDCMEAALPASQRVRPLLVKVCLNEAAKVRCLERTGDAPPDQHVCVNHRCGALMQFLGSLSSLQELVKHP